MSEKKGTTSTQAQDGGHKVPVIQDWAHLVAFEPNLYFRPQNVDELKNYLTTLQRGSLGKRRVRVLGSRHSCSKIFTSDAILDVSGMPRTLEFNQDHSAVTATANWRLHDFLLELSKRGKSPPHLRRPERRPFRSRWRCARYHICVAPLHRPAEWILTWYLPMAGLDVRAERQKVLSAGYAEWEGLVMADLMSAHPGIATRARRLDVMRWGHAMVRPTPGFLWGPAHFAAQESLGEALHFAHSDLGGMALFEEANWFGVKAAEKALKGLGRADASWL